ncbi:hypothetical protein HAX44_13280 [Enterococcus faecalis]|uniref:Uncharacterized protein n=1 Tax=Enterococcus faecalis ATCC 6055 TaxID=1169311 RepID=R3HMM3_ENTFL|nr:hypothetical protein [Enterococcus faecalis]ELS0478121.1 hypothetical protein [Enterococcus faecalis]EOK06763.1 hypothetical protein WOU_03136 [Enterococcus faecalis ATCC 6055]EPH77711.1 hypothetical protein D929_00036 [Enterococcus faecalis 02-MB-P-10]MBF0006582.1 hypothetical protein [Enterococcus faecalis]MBF0009265.1 hypothetical protein [Enterococcus faecalis]
MKFKKRELSLNNLIGLTAPLDLEGDIFDQVIEISGVLKTELMENGYYTNGPILFKYNPFDGEELSVYTTIGNTVNIIGENKSEINFTPHFELTTSYFYRHFDETEKVPYEEIKNNIEENERTLKEIYHVVLDFYGEIVLDMYCEVE